MKENGLITDVDFMKMPKDCLRAIKFIVEILLHHIYPLIKRIGNKLNNDTSDALPEEYAIQISNVYTLCLDQIKKSVMTLIHVVKLESDKKLYLQESRNCTLERLTWCYNKLLSIEALLNTPNDDIDPNYPILAITMYFVNWIDQTFEVLNKLSSIVYKTDVKDDEEEYKKWKNEIVECVLSLHTSIDELLLSALTLCKYCLPDDQPVVKAHCQVVMRETNALLSYLIEGDLNTVKATPETLKLPINPSNINVLIDVFKDVLYVLETNTNTALLALVVHCFSQSVSPANMLKEHFDVSSGTCMCCNDSNVVDNCKVIKEFDLHNERLLNIGSFAMSCSSDQRRILSLRSGLASLEALDPHLVPAVMTSSKSLHSSILIDIWNQEVKQIRDGIFLIVDPAAFADKVKQMMHQKIQEITKDSAYNNAKTCTVINMGCVVYEFFNVYKQFEPDALSSHELLTPLLRDLNKVQMECKIVSNLFCQADDHKYNVKKTQNKNASFGQLVKRLKLLYKLVKSINNILNPSENEFYDEPEMKDITQTILNGNTYVASPRKINNMTRSIFARTNLRSSTGKFPLAVLTKHMKARTNNELSFSVQLDQICNISDIKINREASILYQTPLKTRSLRKAVLSKVVPIDLEQKWNDTEKNISERESMIEDNSLQITDVLNQINDLMCNITASKRSLNSTVFTEKSRYLSNKSTMKFDRVWDISVDDVGDLGVSNDAPSEINTLERINDLYLVESKLSDLKSGQFETSV
ncbi:unnamed protein product [Danaus chrysippus]|uniref:(African queen) hypothetical protein n=1 Tax=Danaus chrysippus TaxID=151541 RepID=A0A8J2W015_9NEOP|nr:unnamed protein product [Danaus chrysippus]